uniref:Uncharacterized protein n=1 Tax=Ditylum brightwellii TaxID=49249 RepID=A0A7S2A0L6_9STRA|mmetsp:Transcript_5378/g.8190  ORF Transcript_5378/g.8190 Transcript_5378/m.8190 type:complete len:563 (+) Transcript_5378:386-2074(+)
MKKLRNNGNGKLKTKGGQGNANSHNSSSSSAISSNCKTTDEHHNLSTPCCILVREVALEIFPDVDQFLDKEEEEDKKERKKHNNERVSMDPQQQPLLGRIIRQHLIHERQVENNQSTSAAASASKKKKKKRNKKKKQSSSSDKNPNEASLDVIVAAEGNSSSLELDKKPQSQDPPPSSHATQKSSPKQQQQQNTNINQSQPTKKQDEASDLDLFLDQYVTSASSINNNNNSQHSTTTLTNRDLTSFVSFLTTRYQHYQQQQQQQDETTTAATTKKHSSTKPKKDKPCAKTPSSSSPNVILPTLSIKDVLNACENTCCRLCRTSASTYLRQLIGPTTATNGNGRTNNLRGIIPNGGGGGARSNNSNWKPTSVANPGCIVIDASSAEIPKRPPQQPRTNNLAIPIPSRHNEDVCSSPNGTQYKKHDDDEDVERAFDYIAMEEGNAPFVPNFSSTAASTENGKHHNDNSSLFRLTMHPITLGDEKDESMERFLQLTSSPSPPSTTSISEDSSQCAFPLTVHDIECMAKYILLPCGIQEVTTIAESVRRKQQQKRQEEEEKEETQG